MSERPLERSLNDHDCLDRLHDYADELRARPSTRLFAEQFESPEDLVETIRSQDQRLDFGDPDDGPRLDCDITQRARFAPDDPNCFERTLWFLTLAPLLDPERTYSSASVIINGGWHTFPVDVTESFPRPIILDPAPPPRNVMLYTASTAKRLTPAARRNLPVWFASVARNTAEDEDILTAYREAMEELRNAILNCDTPKSADFLLSLASDGATLWGAQGDRAVSLVEKSIRNIPGHALWRKLAKKAQDIAPHALRAALVAELGPVGEIAYRHLPIKKIPAPTRPHVAKTKRRLRRMSMSTLTHAQRK